MTDQLTDLELDIARAAYDYGAENGASAAQSRLCDVERAAVQRLEAQIAEFDRHNARHWWLAAHVSACAAMTCALGFRLTFDRWIVSTNNNGETIQDRLEADMRDPDLPDLAARAVEDMDR